MEKSQLEGNERGKLLKENLIALSFILTIPVLNISYFLLNNSKRGASSLATLLDQSIPFMKIFIIPYVAWYGFIIITFIYLCIKDKDAYYKTLISYDIGLVICYIVYFVYQTTVQRPIINDNDILSRMTLLIYKMDQPYNCFPSIHVLTCYLMIKGINMSTARTKLNSILVTVISVIIIISTLFTKQHVVLDAVGGIFIADIVFRLVWRIDRERVLLWIKKQYSLLMMRKKLET